MEKFKFESERFFIKIHYQNQNQQLISSKRGEPYQVIYPQVLSMRRLTSRPLAAVAEPEGHNSTWLVSAS